MLITFGYWSYRGANCCSSTTSELELICRKWSQISYTETLLTFTYIFWVVSEIMGLDWSHWTLLWFFFDAQQTLHNFFPKSAVVCNFSYSVSSYLTIIVILPFYFKDLFTGSLTNVRMKMAHESVNLVAWEFFRVLSSCLHLQWWLLCVCVVCDRLSQCRAVMRQWVTPLTHCCVVRLPVTHNSVPRCYSLISSSRSLMTP